MLWSRESHVIRLYVNGYIIPISILTNLLFSIELPTKLLQTPCCCHLYLFCINLDITSYTSTLAFSQKKVLCIL